MTDLYVPPQNLEAEQSVLGAVLFSNSALDEAISAGLKAADFFREDHRLVFAGMVDLLQNADPIDLVTLPEALRKTGTLEKIGGPAYLAQLADAVGTAANVKHYVGIVREKAALREIQRAAANAQDMVQDPAVDSAAVLQSLESEILLVWSSRNGHGQLPRLDQADVTASLVAMEERAKTKALPGVPSGFYDLDRLTSGFQPSDLVIVAGRSSMGKTALALNFALNAHVPVVFFSLEMSAEQLKQRLLARLSGVDGLKIKSGQDLTVDDFGRLLLAAQSLAEREIYVDESSSLTVLDVRSRVRSLEMRLRHEDRHLGLIVVDYLQLMRGIGENREQEVASLSRGLKALAKELHVPVMALAQLNRQVEGRGDKRPLLSDLRESGAIEQDADLVMFVYRDEVYDPHSPDAGMAEILIRKQRNGPIGTVYLVWRAECSAFDSASRDTVEAMRGRKPPRRRRDNDD